MSYPQSLIVIDERRKDMSKTISHIRRELAGEEPATIEVSVIGGDRFQGDWIDYSNVAASIYSTFDGIVSVENVALEDIVTIKIMRELANTVHVSPEMADYEIAEGLLQELTRDKGEGHIHGLMDAKHAAVALGGTRHLLHGNSNLPEIRAMQDETISRMVADIRPANNDKMGRGDMIVHQAISSLRELGFFKAALNKDVVTGNFLPGTDRSRFLRDAFRSMPKEDAAILSAEVDEYNLTKTKFLKVSELPESIRHVLMGTMLIETIRNDARHRYEPYMSPVHLRSIVSDFFRSAAETN